MRPFPKDPHPKINTRLLALFFSLLSLPLFAQDGGMYARFGLDTEMHYSTMQETKGFYSGSYLTGSVGTRFVDLSLRFEELSHPLPGREAERGWGLPFVALTGRYEGVSLTLGDVYEQFGSGLLLRAYEDRALGIDNSIRGARLAYAYRDAFSLKVLGGQQRNHFDRGWRLFAQDRGSLYGADAEIAPLSFFQKGENTDPLSLRIGGSYVLKHEAEDEISRVMNGTLYRLRQPVNVSAWSARLSLSQNDWNVYAEYARKGDDPSVLNGFVYRPGSAVMLTASYLWRHSSLFLGVRRAENFDFRSERTAGDNDLKVNFLRPFIRQHTYRLAAFYAYATQPLGEWSFQADFATKFPKGTPLGGRYGLSMRASASVVRGTKKEPVSPDGQGTPTASDLIGTNGLESSFFGLGDPLFHDFDLEVTKKFSRSYTMSLSYLNQSYNRLAIEGHAGADPVINSHIFVYEGKHKLSPKVTLRTELQYFMSREAEGDWLFGLVECALAPHFVFSISDLWNAGVTKEHFYMGSVAWSGEAHRLQLSYGKTVDGVNCSGGVCRYMPATRGLYLTYSVAL